MAYRKPNLEGRAKAHPGLDGAERRQREAFAAEEKLRTARMANMARLRTLRLEKEAAEAAEAARIALESPPPVKKVRKKPVGAVTKAVPAAASEKAVAS
jgi:hypothetical protein